MSKKRVNALFIILDKIDEWRLEVLEEIEELSE